MRTYLQEILHRYAAISRPDAIQPAFDALLEQPSQVERMQINWRLSARDTQMNSPAGCRISCIFVNVSERLMLGRFHRLSVSLQSNYASCWRRLPKRPPK